MSSGLSAGPVGGNLASATPRAMRLSNLRRPKLAPFLKASSPRRSRPGGESSSIRPHLVDVFDELSSSKDRIPRLCLTHTNTAMNHVVASDDVTFIGLQNGCFSLDTSCRPAAGAVVAGASMVAGASGATKAASIIGAALGADITRRLFQHRPDTPMAKKFLRDMFAKKHDKLKIMFMSNADDWIAVCARRPIVIRQIGAS